MDLVTIYEEKLKAKLGAFLAFALVVFAILIGKLWYLQIIKGHELQRKAEVNRIRIHRVAAPRGLIYDRNHRLLVDNRLNYVVYFNPNVLPPDERQPFLEDICAKLNVDFEYIKKRFQAMTSGLRFIKIKSGIAREELAKIQTWDMEYHGEYPLEIEEETKREYPLGKFMAHSLGFCGEIDKQQLESPEYVDYRPGDLVGKMGIEATYEADLKGIYGKERFEEDANRNKIRTLDSVSAKPGDNLVLTIDVDLQKAVMQAFGDTAGAIVALDPRNGEILALLSNPSFNPEILSPPVDPKQWQQLLDDPKSPLMNKVIAGLYPPGSTYKVVAALGGLEEGTITTRTVHLCPGFWNFGGRQFNCHSSKGHGEIALHRAVVQSCDVFFYHVGHDLGIDNLAIYARELGFGEKTGIDIDSEKEGLVPTRDWKSRVKKENWSPGETLLCAIGQGYSLVTPLQMAVAYMTIANHGYRYRPKIVLRIESRDGKVVKKNEPELMAKSNIKEHSFDLVQKALIGVVNEDGGTGGRARMDSILVAGKTGTSQVTGMGKHKIKSSSLPYERRDHAWFVCYAPAENSEIVVAVLAEHSGHGGVVAAPIARQVLSAYFSIKRQREKGIVQPIVDIAPPSPSEAKGNELD